MSLVHAIYQYLLSVLSVDLLRLNFLDRRLPDIDAIQRPVEVESCGDEGDVRECLGGVLN